MSGNDAIQLRLTCEYWPPGTINLCGSAPELEALARWLSSARPPTIARLSGSPEPGCAVREASLAGVDLEEWGGGVRFSHRADRFVISADSAGLKWLADGLAMVAEDVREEGEETHYHFWYTGEGEWIPKDSYELIVEGVPAGDGTGG